MGGPRGVACALHGNMGLPRMSHSARSYEISYGCRHSSHPPDLRFCAFGTASAVITEENLEIARELRTYARWGLFANMTSDRAIGGNHLSIATIWAPSLIQLAVSPHLNLS